MPLNTDMRRRCLFISEKFIFDLHSFRIVSEILSDTKNGSSLRAEKIFYSVRQTILLKIRAVSKYR